MTLANGTTANGTTTANGATTVGATESHREPIAVVGIGLRFPGGIESAEKLWSTLLDRTEFVGDIPSDRYDAKYFHNADSRAQGSIRFRRGGFLDDVYGFDAPFFNMFPADAAIVDPLQRLALEAAYHALEDAGMPSDAVAGTRTSCFVGGFWYDYMCMQSDTAARDLIGPHAEGGIGLSALANRVSYKLDLRGPSVSLDTACSSSLVALHLACQSIWYGEADAAIAGGVNALLRPESSILLGKAGFLSPDGVCRSFDAKGNGYVRSEGAGMVYVKPLKDALRDGSRIYGVIRGSLINSDGFTPEGMTVPSIDAQSTLLRTVYSQAGVDPAAVSYIQAHGPGTVVGDPKEAGALGGYLGSCRSSSDDPLWLSSIKGNVGHLEGAAGIAGFITALLAAYHGKAPPQANHTTPNPAIDFEGLRIGIPLETVDLKPKMSDTIVVGVNSFGAGGTNSHAIIEAPPPKKPASPPSRKSRAVLLSAKSPDALQAIATNLKAFIAGRQADLADVVYTLNGRRTRHPHAAVVSFEDSKDLCSKLDTISEAGSSKEVFSFQRTAFVDKVAFVFSGIGGQWGGMGKALVDKEPVFAESISEFNELFIKHAGRSLLPEVFQTSKPDPLDRTVNAQPAITMIQIALARTLMSYGIRPQTLIGHSVGEVAAAHISGALSLEDTVRIIHLRATIQSKAAGKGGMLATAMSENEARELLSRLELTSTVEIATLSGPRMTTLAGDIESLEIVASDLQENDAFARFVKAEVPFHSRFMDPLKDEMLEALTPFHGSQIQDFELYSSVTAKREPGTHLTPEYWWNNARNPVQYSKAVQEFLTEADSPTLLIEIGPHPVLVSGTRTAADDLGLKNIYVVPAMIRNNDIAPLAHVLGAASVLCNAATKVDLDSFNGGPGNHITLPPYPFQRKHYSYEHPMAKQTRLMTGAHPFFASVSTLSDSSRGILKLRISSTVTPFLEDHVVDGSPVFPATGFIECVYLAAEKLVASGQSLWLENMTFDHALVLPASGGGSGDTMEWAPEVMLELTSTQKHFVVSSRRVTSNSSLGGPWTACSRGRINNVDSFDFSSLIPKDLSSVRARVEKGAEMSSNEFYDNLEAAGYRYGDLFRGVRNIWQLGDETLAILKLPEPCEEESDRFHFHPAMLDACVHTIFAYWMNGLGAKHMYLPHRWEKVLVNDCRGIKEALVYGRTTRFDDKYFNADICVFDMDGKVLAVLAGLTNKSVLSTSIRHETEYQTLYELQPAPQYECAEIDFTSILFIGEQSSTLSGVVRNAFPSAELLHHPVASRAEILDLSSLSMKFDRRTLIILAPLDDDVNQPEATADDEQNLVGRNLGVIIGIARCIQEAQVSTTFIALTRGACPTAMDDACGTIPASSAIEAATRVLSNEQQQCRVRVIDLPIRSSASQAANDDPELYPLLTRELRQHGTVWRDTVTALRPGGKRFVRRVVAVNEEEALDNAAKSVQVKGGAYHCEVDTKGSTSGAQLANIVVRQQQSRSLGADDVVIAVHAAGVCFGDVLNATDTSNANDSDVPSVTSSTLGHEVSGEILECGANVKNLQIGEKVMARVAHGFSGRVTTHQDLVMPVPSGLSIVQAAAIPVCYLTAYYALVYLAQLSPGESVLIHSAAGGVGFAAMQFAKMKGARIFATAGSPDRRKHVLSLGAEKVFDSRSIAFHDDIMSATDGRGVDVVLNSLSGALISQSAACLAPFGRFVEIGKTAMIGNLKLSQFDEGSSLFLVDIDRLPVPRPALHRKLFEDVFNLLDTSKVTGPPVTEYPVSALSAALKDVLRSDIIGKAVISMCDQEKAEIKAQRPTMLELRPDRTYLLTGGSSGLGLQMAKFFAERGAKHLTLVSRSGTKGLEDELLLASIKAMDVDVHLVSADITDSAAVNALVHDSKRPPLAGIVHSAAVLHDLYAHNTTMDDHLKVFRPKSIGAWNLHAATENVPLDFFIMVSSISATLSFIGQVSYSMANHYLDGLSHFRHSRGLPALSINLGLLGTYAGMTRKSTLSDQVTDILYSAGHRTMLLSAVLDSFERAMLDRAAARMALSMDWGMWLKAYPHLIYDAAFSHLNNTTSRQSSASASSSSKNPLADLSGPALVDAITGELQRGMARIVGLEVAQVSVDETIESYAADSITMTQVSGMILREFRVRYAIMKLLTWPTLREIAAEVATSFSNDTEGEDQADGHASDAIMMALPEGLHAVSDLFVKGNTSPKPGSSRLICLHSMGTGASLFAPFLMDEPTGFEVVAVQLPGRENRAHEPFPQDAFAVAEEIAENLLNEYDPSERDVIWGHSFGGLLSFLTLRILRRKHREIVGGDKTLPRLVITGTIAPHLGAVWQKRDILLAGFYEDLSPDYLLAVSRYVDDADFVRSIMYGIRMDGPMLLSYHFDDDEEPLNIPITAFAAQQDDVVYPDEVEQWQQQVGDQEFNFIKVDGDHWFIHRNRALLRETIEAMAQGITANGGK